MLIFSLFLTVFLQSCYAYGILQNSSLRTQIPEHLFSSEQFAIDSSRDELKTVRRRNWIWSYCCKAAVLFSVDSAYSDSRSINPEITSKVFMDFASNEESFGRVVFGLFGKDSPDAVSCFLSVVDGRFKGISYNGSSVALVEKGNRIELGKIPAGADKYEVRKVDKTGVLRRQTFSAAEDLVVNDKNELKHDQLGIISYPKGGKSFQFSMSLGPNAALDDRNVVFGKVISGFEVIKKIESVPVTREDILGSKKFFAEVGKGFDPRARIISISRPITRVFVARAGSI